MYKRSVCSNWYVYINKCLHIWLIDRCVTSFPPVLCDLSYMSKFCRQFIKYISCSYTAFNIILMITTSQLSWNYMHLSCKLCDRVNYLFYIEAIGGTFTKCLFWLSPFITLSSAAAYVYTVYPLLFFCSSFFFLWMFTREIIGVLGKKSLVSICFIYHKLYLLILQIGYICS
jgi:hypothetical protein